MRILVVSNFYPPHFIGGAEIIAHQQALALAARGHEVRVLAGDTSRKPRIAYQLEQEIVDGLPVTRVALQPTDFAVNGNNVAHRQVDEHFRKLIATWQPDVVHAHHLIGLSLGILRIARQAGIRVALTLHDHWGFCINSTRITTQGELCQDATQCHQCHAHVYDGPTRLPQRMRQDYVWWQLQAVDYFISPSQYLADAYIGAGWPAERVNVIANGIDLERFAATHPAPRGSRLNLLFIGYLGPHKGLPTLLGALALLAQHSIHIDFVGDGHARAEYEAQVQRIASPVAGKSRLTYRFWGRVPNQQIAGFYAKAHVFLLPSVCPENQPVTITEAMASGLPVVASRIGGIPELVAHGHTGYLADAGDADDLAAQITNYLVNPSLVQAHGKAARAFIQSFAFEAKIDAIEALLASPSALAGPTQRLVATHGEPPAVTFDKLVGDLAPIPHGVGAPHDKSTQPGWIPAGWIEAEQAEFLWVAGAGRGRLDDALDQIAHFQTSGRPVLVDERYQQCVRKAGDAVLTAKSDEQTVFTQKLLLAKRIRTGNCTG
jgi:glycosyltransferase involved in cell wall biosynthesis